MSKKTITVAQATSTRQVELHEDGRVMRYDVRPVTRSVRRQLVDMQQRMDALQMPEDRPPSEEEEEAAVRALVDFIDVLLAPAGDTPRPASDVLFDAWMADLVTDEAIGQLVQDLTPDPPR